MRAYKLYKDGRPTVRLTVDLPTETWNQWVIAIALCAYTRWFRPSGKYPKTSSFVPYLMREMYQQNYHRWQMRAWRKYDAKIEDAVNLAIEKGLVVVVDENYDGAQTKANPANMAEIRHKPQQWDDDVSDPMDDY